MYGGLSEVFNRMLMAQMGLFIASALPGIGDVINNMDFNNQLLLSTGIGIISMFMDRPLATIGAYIGKGLNILSGGKLASLGFLGKIGFGASALLGLGSIGYGAYQMFTKSDEEKSLEESYRDAIKALAQVNISNVDLSGAAQAIEAARTSRIFGGLTKIGAGLLAAAPALFFLNPFIGLGAGAIGALTLGIGTIFGRGSIDENVAKGISAQVKTIANLSQQLSLLNERIEEAEKNPLISTSVLSSMYKQREELRNRIRFQSEIANEMSIIGGENAEDVGEKLAERLSAQLKTTSGKELTKLAATYISGIKNLLNYEADDIADALEKEIQVPTTDPRIKVKKNISSILTENFVNILANSANLPREALIESIKDTEALIAKIPKEEFGDIFGSNKENLKNVITGINAAIVKGTLLDDKDILSSAEELKAVLKTQVLSNPKKVAELIGKPELAGQPDKLFGEIEKQFSDQKFDLQKLLTPEQIAKAKTKLEATGIYFKTLLESPGIVEGFTDYIVSPSGKMVRREELQKANQKYENIIQKMEIGEPLSLEDIKFVQKMGEIKAQTGFTNIEQFIANVQRNIKEFQNYGVYLPNEFIGKEYSQMYMQLISGRNVAAAQLDRVNQRIAEITTQLQTSMLSKEQQEKLINEYNILQTQKESLQKDLGQYGFIEDQLKYSYIGLQVERMTKPATDFIQEAKFYKELVPGILYSQAPDVFAYQVYGYNPLSYANLLPAQLAPQIDSYAAKMVSQIFSTDLPDFEKVRLAAPYISHAARSSPELYDEFVQKVLNTTSSMPNPSELLKNFGINTTLPSGINQAGEAFTQISSSAKQAASALNALASAASEAGSRLKGSSNITEGIEQISLNPRLGEGLSFLPSSTSDLVASSYLHSNLTTVSADNFYNMLLASNGLLRIPDSPREMSE